MQTIELMSLNDLSKVLEDATFILIVLGLFSPEEKGSLE